MRTPCQQEPEKWVSDLVADRAYAARKCLDCPVEAFTACAALAVNTHPDLGVYAGTDYHPTNRIPQTKSCEECGLDFPRRKGDNNAVWQQRRFCSRQCAGLARSAETQVALANRTKACAQCGIVFSRPGASQAQFASQAYCSVRCGGLARRKAAA